MKQANILVRWGAHLVFERPVRKLSMGVLITELNQSAKDLTSHLDNCPDTPNNRRKLSHMVGIERWGQRRLRVSLGEPFLTEEYDHYCPSIERTWEELISEWVATRNATIALASNMVKINVSPECKIEHNQYGFLSIKAWLRYLDVHSISEGKRISNET